MQHGKSSQLESTSTNEATFQVDFFQGQELPSSSRVKLVALTHDLPERALCAQQVLLGSQCDCA
jgi:hypothetical protein